MTLKNIFSVLLIAFTSTIAGPSTAKEGNPAFWLVMPFAKAISNCSAYGPEVRQRLTDALATAKENTKGKLPESIWTLLGSMNISTENKEYGQDVVKACDGVIEMFRNPQFATHFRQTIVAQLVSPPALQCIIEQPTRAREVKEAWLRAFLRNGMELTEKSIDETIDASRNYIINQKSGSKPSVSDCEQLSAQFSSRDFDAKYGEKGIYDLLANF